MDRHPRLFLPLLVVFLFAGALTAVAQEAPPPAPPASDDDSPADPVADPDDELLVAARAKAREVLTRAAARQGTATLSGEKAIRRFRAQLDVIVYGDDGKYQTSSDEAYAEPLPRRKHARVHSDYTAEGRHVRLGHDGVKGWIWSKADGVRLLTDPEGRDRADYEDLRHRQRMLGLARRAFFLGNLLDDETPLVHRGEGDLTLPPRPGSNEPRRFKAIRLQRPATADDPQLELWLDAATYDPIAVVIPPADDKESEHLLVVAFEDPEIRGDALPKGLRVPYGIELWERYPDGDRERVLRLDAVIDRLRIGADEVPDSLFKAP